MIRKLLHLLLFTVTISSCNTNTVPNPMNGIWQSIGSGTIVEIDQDYYTFYDINAISCLEITHSKVSEFGNGIKLQNDTLSITKGVLTYNYIKIDELPDSCDRAWSEEDKNDPIANFEVFARTIEEHYAFFDINNIAWDSLYKQQKFKIDSNSSPAELYIVIEETLELLNDNHGYLEASDEFYEENEEALEVDEEEQVTDDKLVEYGDFQIANMVTKHYLVEDMTKDSWLINWGKMQNNIGYIQIKAMWLYADLKLDQSKVESNGFVDTYVDIIHKLNESAYIELERQGVGDILERVMNDLRNSDKIIIDVRFNGGGQDAVTFEILKRFNEKYRQVASQKLRDGSSFTKDQQLYLDMVDAPYRKPTYVLTSTQTGSAAESFALATMAIPHMKRIGSNTSGAMSTALEKQLPNGWHFALSNELFMDTHGNNYENIGVPSDYAIPYSNDRQTFFRYIANNLELDKQAILQAIAEDDLN